MRTASSSSTARIYGGKAGRYWLLVTALAVLPKPCAAVLPDGVYDYADCSVSNGWACDGDDYNRPIGVQFFTDGPTDEPHRTVLLGSAVADQPRPDLAPWCGGTTAHEFTFNLPSQSQDGSVNLRDGKQHYIYAFANDIDANGTLVNLTPPQLRGSPRIINNCAPTPAPTLLPPSGLSPADGAAFPPDTSSVLLSWTAAAGAASYLVIADDQTDSTRRASSNHCPDNNHYLCVDQFAATSIALPVVAGHSYLWGVQSMSAAGQYSGPAVAGFTVRSPAPPPAPILTSIAVAPSAATIASNGTQQFTAAAKDQFGNAMPGITLSWASSNAQAATIDGSGLAAGKNMGSSALTTTITASASGITSTAALTVNPAPPQPPSTCVPNGSCSTTCGTGLDRCGNSCTNLSGCPPPPPSTPPPAALSANAADWLVKTVCADSGDRPLPTDPFLGCGAGSSPRKLRIGDPLPYHNIDQGGYQQNDSFPIKDAAGNVIFLHTFDYPPFNQFNLYDGSDGYDVYSIGEDWVAVGNTRDGGGFGTTFYGEGCRRDNGWVLFPTRNFLQGGAATRPISGVYWEQGGQSFPGRCPVLASYADSSTAWALLRGFSFGGVRGNPVKNIDTVVSYHGDQTQDHMEALYFTQLYGLTRWEAWASSNLNPAPSSECFPNRVTYKGTEFIVTDCRDWSVVTPAAQATVPLWPIPDVNMLASPHFDDDGFLSNWGRQGTNADGHIINWSLLNSKTPADSAYAAAGVRYLATNCGGACEASQQIYQDLPIGSFVSGGVYGFGVDVRTESGSGTIQIALSQIDGNGNVMDRQSIEGSASSDNGNIPGRTSVVLTSRPLYAAARLSIAAGAQKLRFSISPRTPQTFYIIDAWLAPWPAAASGAPPAGPPVSGGGDSPTSTDNAAAIFSLAPNRMTIGPDSSLSSLGIRPAGSAPAARAYLVSVAFKNDGSSLWNSDYSLALQSTASWSVSRIPLAPGETVRPGQIKIFTYLIQPPSTPGTYSLRFQMQHGTTFFGDLSPEASVRVDAGTPASEPDLAKAAASLDKNQDPSAGIKITIHGRGFAPGAVVLYTGPVSGSAPALVLDPKTLQFTLPLRKSPSGAAATLSASNQYQVAVQNPDGSQSPGIPLSFGSAGSNAGGVSFKEAYVYPNPLVGSKRPTFHAEVQGAIDELKIKVYDAAGDTADAISLPVSDAASGAEGSSVYEYVFDNARLASGIYVWVAEARQGGASGAKKSGKFAVVR